MAGAAEPGKPDREMADLGLFDTGNAFLAGEDPYAFLEAVKSKVVHVHAKDIEVKQAGAERGIKHLR